GRRALLGLMGLALLALGWLAAPLVRRHVAFFQVRQIELLGVRNLAPDAVIAALRLPDEASVFSDTRMLADRVRGLAGVADARVVRRLPAALRVELKEVEPAALVAGRGLMVVDAAGRPLPFDPARAAGGGGLDLPEQHASDSGVVGVLALIRSVDAALFQAISGARGYARGDVLVEIGARRVLLGRDAGPEVIRGVVQVAQDLAAKGRPYRELDARFAGQVVVRPGARLAANHHLARAVRGPGGGSPQAERRGVSRDRQLVAGLDLGSTKTCAVIAEVVGDVPRVPLAKVLGVGLAKNAGVRRGMVRDIGETTRSIAGALRDAERMAGGRVSGVT